MPGSRCLQTSPYTLGVERQVSGYGLVSSRSSALFLCAQLLPAECEALKMGKVTTAQDPKVTTSVLSFPSA